MKCWGTMLMMWIEDVSEDERLQKSLRVGGYGFASDDDSDSQMVGSKLFLTMEERVEEEEVNLMNLNSGSDFLNDWRASSTKKNDKVRVRCICRGKVPQFGCEDGDDDGGSKGVVSSGSKGKGQSKEKGQVSGSKRKSNNKTKAGGGIKDKGEYCPWSLQCSKLPNEETWKVKTFKDTHKCLQSRIVKKCTASFLSKSVEESIKPNPKIPLNALKDHNPNTTIKIEVEPPEDIHSTERKFKRVYVCLGRAHCDLLLNNMYEVLNRQLVDGRDKPIITCLEFIREYIMKRIVTKSDGPLTPNATKVFKTIVKHARQIKIEWNGGDLYQANTP
ncbi:hypothetical protein Tco_1026518, partial [Tanacetum coccineum]